MEDIDEYTILIRTKSAWLLIFLTMGTFALQESRLNWLKVGIVLAIQKLKLGNWMWGKLAHNPEHNAIS